MESTIIKKDSLVKIQKTMSRLKNIDKTLNDDINNIVEKSTKNEKEQLDIALKKYNDSLTKALNSPEVKSKIEKKKNNNESINKLMDKVQTAFQKAIQEINKQPIEEKEKQNKIRQLGKAITEAILSDEEKNILKTINLHMRNLPFQSVKFIC
uniref:Uncharacterized protein n=1 Tax=viral metagenome TaxID=1070528 RepID=A0A6C0IW72_9ZZZZ